MQELAIHPLVHPSTQASVHPPFRFPTHLVNTIFVEESSVTLAPFFREREREGDRQKVIALMGLTVMGELILEKKNSPRDRG